MAGNAANLIPRKKGESQEQFVKRVHSETQRRRGVRSAKGEGRNLTKYAPREFTKSESRREPKKMERYRTTGIQIGNPFKGEATGRIRERVKA